MGLTCIANTSSSSAISLVCLLSCRNRWQSKPVRIYLLGSHTGWLLSSSLLACLVRRSSSCSRSILMAALETTCSLMRLLKATAIDDLLQLKVFTHTHIYPLFILVEVHLFSLLYDAPHRKCTQVFRLILFSFSACFNWKSY